MQKVAHRGRQKGATIITTCLLLLFLLGFMAFALDFGRLFIVKTELQTAMDSCALSAAQELDQLGTAIARARSAGTTAANVNRVNLQSVNWDSKGQLAPDTDIAFYDSNFVPTTVDAAAAYVECSHVQPDVRLWLLRAMAAFSGNTTTFPATHDVGARAIAKRGSSQTTCPIPVAFKPNAGGTPPMYGLMRGEWKTIYGARLAGNGEFGWYNLDGSTSAKSTRDQLESGICNTRVGDTLGTPGAKTAVDEEWNYRFGIYRHKSDDIALHRPDYSGYAYTETNWTNAATLTLSNGTTTTHWNAYAGAPNTALSHATAQNYVIKQGAYASFDDTGTDLDAGSTIVFGDPKRLNSFKSPLATPGIGGEHQQYGFNRRVATVPVIDDGNHVIDYFCAFLLQPMTGPTDDVKIEVIGPASDASSPCTTSGVPGGSAGPLVPVLVR
ncbi:MAG TPA: pilus assembly protein TadG-related protein [Burkholderiales bacterium]